ncbi:acetyl-CoA carboxylase biotin carboxyl carrier protein [Bacteroides propionicifaciens]|jgi:glutaconyl-CoA/methylmalonyl-CoA decarboxylase subunit gamma|uniref:acetyl-CoA carboxylase biotin carboxyl carrier protein n=1 Tax=Bacteroides propionicifaciens TaxID=392838 RepID=UPI0003748D07|nr:biotin/lipoyl-containing protein [Bacteroides propionicifaciens]
MKEYKYKINGKDFKVVINDIKDNIASVEVNGNAYEVEMEKQVAPVIEKPAPVAAPVQEAAQPSAPSAGSGKGTGIQSPLPGVIVDIKVNVGDTVKRGQTVLILEAMKMENTINATKDGKVSAIKVNKGDSVLEGTDLIIIE